MKIGKAIKSDQQRILEENIREPSIELIESFRSNLSEVQIEDYMKDYPCSREEAEIRLADYLAWNYIN